MDSRHIGLERRTLMKSKLLTGLVAGAIASLFSGAAAFAQTAPKPASTPERAERAQKSLAEIDKNKDGMIDRQEAAGHKWLEKDFDAIDTNKDGKLSREELKAHHDAMRGKRADKFEEFFKAADTNGDGVITKAEAEASKMPGLAKHFDNLDTNKDGKLTREEMQAAHSRGHGDAGKPREGGERGDHAAGIEERFKMADKDGDGALTKAEVQAANMPYLARDFDRIDANKDGKITKEELRAALSQRRDMRKEGKEGKEQK
jgi:Ca2+-binding EF-hand superfamily protein